MSEPLADVGEATREQFPVRAYMATITAVDTVTATCTITVDTGPALAGIIYVGPAPVVGRQVVYLTFRRTAVVLGGG